MISTSFRELLTSFSGSGHPSEDVGHRRHSRSSLRPSGLPSSRSLHPHSHGRVVSVPARTKTSLVYFSFMEKTNKKFQGRIHEQVLRRYRRRIPTVLLREDHQSI